MDNSKEKIDLVSETIRHDQVEFIHEDWKEVIPKGPFQFIFADAAAAKTIEGEQLVNALEVGGMLFMDDFTPEEHFPEEWKGKTSRLIPFFI